MAFVIEKEATQGLTGEPGSSTACVRPRRIQICAPCDPLGLNTGGLNNGLGREGCHVSESISVLFVAWSEGKSIRSSNYVSLATHLRTEDWYTVCRIWGSCLQPEQRRSPHSGCTRTQTPAAPCAPACLLHSRMGHRSSTPLGFCPASGPGGTAAGQCAHMPPTVSLHGPRARTQKGGWLPQAKVPSLVPVLIARTLRPMECVLD